jgi:hypothetical protein
MWFRTFDGSPVFYEAAADDDETVEGTDRPTAIPTMPDKCHAMKTGFFIHEGRGGGISSRSEERIGLLPGQQDLQPFSALVYHVDSGQADNQGQSL